MNQDSFNLNKWFVLYTKPKHELEVVDNLLNIGIESYCPMITSNRIWSDRIKKIKEVLIKSTVFVRCTDEERGIVFDIPSTVKYLFHCKKPAVVFDSEIKHLKRLEQNNYIINKDLSIGDIVFLDKVNQTGFVEKKTKSKTWINLKNINIRICI